MNQVTRASIEKELLNPELSVSSIANRFGVDETDIISIIHSKPKLRLSAHDRIDVYLKQSDFVAAGQVRTGKWADKFAEKLSPHTDVDFFEIRNRDPQRRKYAVTDENIIVRKCIDGTFFDLEYALNDEIARLIKSLRK